MTKIYRLIDAPGHEYASPINGTLGGNRAAKIYGQLDCSSALRALNAGGPYRGNRVFFADEGTAIAAGYRPCGRCMRTAYLAWKTAGERAAAPQ